MTPDQDQYLELQTIQKYLNVMKIFHLDSEVESVVHESFIAGIMLIYVVLFTLGRPTDSGSHENRRQ